MKTWSRLVFSALLVGGLFFVLGQRESWSAYAGSSYNPLFPLAVGALVIAAVLTTLRGSSHKMARAAAVLQAAGPEQAAGRADRGGVLIEKLERTLAGILEPGERVDVNVRCGTGQAIVVTDRRAIVMRATPFRKSARVRGFPFQTVAFAELRTNLNIQGGRLRIGLPGDVMAGPFAPVRPSWHRDEMKFVDFSLEWQAEMERAAALITERSGAAPAAVPASM